MGNKYTQKLRNAIVECDRFVFFVSAHSIEKGSYALSELRIATDNQVEIFPVRLDDTPTSAAPASLRLLNWFEPSGNLTAELSAQFAPKRSKRRNVVLTVAGTAAIAVVVAIVGWKPWQERSQELNVSPITVAGGQHVVFSSTFYPFGDLPDSSATLKDNSPIAQTELEPSEIEEDGRVDARVKGTFVEFPAFQPRQKMRQRGNYIEVDHPISISGPSQHPVTITTITAKLLYGKSGEKGEHRPVDHVLFYHSFYDEESVALPNGMPEPNEVLRDRVEDGSTPSPSTFIVPQELRPSESRFVRCRLTYFVDQEQVNVVNNNSWWRMLISVTYSVSGRTDVVKYGVTFTTDYDTATAEEPSGLIEGRIYPDPYGEMISQLLLKASPWSNAKLSDRW